MTTTTSQAVEAAERERFEAYWDSLASDGSESQSETLSCRHAARNAWFARAALPRPLEVAAGVELTDDQIMEIADSVECSPDDRGWGPKFSALKFARAVLAASRVPVASVAEPEHWDKLRKLGWRQHDCKVCGESWGAVSESETPPMAVGAGGSVGAVPRKIWPFVESPGEFTERLRNAIKEFGDLLAAVRNVLIENPAQIKQGADGPLSELTRERLSGVEGSILNHDWRDSPAYGGEICASCGAVKGSARGMRGCATPAPEQAAPVSVQGGRNVITTYICPPIPGTEFDWMAHMDGDEEGPTGYGPTELEAVKALCELLARAEA